MAITQVITTLPAAPDPATMTRDEFNTAAAAYVLAQKAMVPELNTWAGEVNAIAATAVGDVATAIGAAAADTPVGADELCWRKTATGLLKKVTFTNALEWFASVSGSSSRVFSVSTATAAAHAPRASQLSNPKIVPVNGCSMADQVNGGALITPTTGSYPIDNVLFSAAQASKIQTQQITTSLLTLNASHALRFSVLSQYTAGAAEAFSAQWKIEGIDIANWQWGTANASAVSLQFKARASVAGTYSGVIRNEAATRSYGFTFTLSANTDTLVKIENIPGDTAGTWVTGEAGALAIVFDLGSGSSTLGGSGSWLAAGYTGVTGSAAFVAQVNGSTLDITDVFINEGPFCREFPKQRYADVLHDSQRYLPTFIGYGTNDLAAEGSFTTTAAGIVNFKFTVTPRIPPTGVTVSNVSHFTLTQPGLVTSTATAIAFSSASKYAARMTATGTGTPYTAGTPAALSGNNTAARLFFTGAQI